MAWFTLFIIFGKMFHATSDSTTKSPQKNAALENLQNSLQDEPAASINNTNSVHT
jgi:hypothetical protein